MSHTIPPDSSAFPVIDAATGRAVRELVRGCTFDDFLLAPQHSVLTRRDPAAIDLSCRLSRAASRSKRPIVSANMDTVTRAPMAIVQAEEGGIGIIDRGFRPGEIEPQVREVEIVKRTQHGVITRSVHDRRRMPPWRKRPLRCADPASARWWSSTASASWRAAHRARRPVRERRTAPGGASG